MCYDVDRSTAEETWKVSPGSKAIENRRSRATAEASPTASLLFPFPTSS